MKKFLVGAWLAALLVCLPGTTPAEEKAVAKDTATAEVIHAGDNAIKASGVYTVEVVRDGKVVESQTIHNIVTLEGRRYLLDAGLHNNSSANATLGHADFTEKAAWYVKLMGVNVAPVSTHTHQSADIGGANEFQAYTGNRVAWTGVLADVGGGLATTTNSASKASFPITGSGTLYGAGLVSLNTKGSVAAGDYMISYAQFSSPIAVVNLDTVNVTITITLN